MGGSDSLADLSQVIYRSPSFYALLDESVAANAVVGTWIGTDEELDAESKENGRRSLDQPSTSKRRMGGKNGNRKKKQKLF